MTKPTFREANQKAAKDFREAFKGFRLVDGLKASFFIVLAFSLYNIATSDEK